MIYTCTSNPSLDYYLTFSEIKRGKNNRSELEMFDAGGKGVNVSIVLNNFQIQSSCLGFLGGFTKDFYLSYIAKFPNIRPLFTSIKDNTRINVKIMDNSQETSLNAIGPHISNEEFNKFKNRLLNIYGDDIFVLSGSIQDEIEDEMVKIIEELSLEGVKIVIDSEPEIVKRSLIYKPMLIKLNDNYELYNQDSLFKKAKEILDSGVKYVLYSAINKPSYFFSKEHTLKVNSLENNLVNTTGSSDSMVAGFLYGKLRGANDFELFKYANAASLATSLTNDLDSKIRLEEIFNKIEVIEL